MERITMNEPTRPDEKDATIAQAAETTIVDVPPDVVDATRPQPVMSFFTRVARFSPRTRRWHASNDSSRDGD
jgi:hypothetical protein